MALSILIRHTVKWVATDRQPAQWLNSVNQNTFIFLQSSHRTTSWDDYMAVAVLISHLRSQHLEKRFES